MLKQKETSRRARANRAQEVAEASDLRSAAAERARRGPLSLESGSSSGNLGGPMDLESEDNDGPSQTPSKRRSGTSTVAGVKRRLVEVLEGGRNADLVRLHIAANDSAEAFNALTARQIDSNAAQALVVNGHREVELDLARQTVVARKEEVGIARDRLALDARLADQRLVIQREELAIARERQTSSVRMEGQIDALNQGFGKLEGTMCKVESFLKDLVRGGGAKQ